MTQNDVSEALTWMIETIEKAVSKGKKEIIILRTYTSALLS